MNPRLDPKRDGLLSFIFMILVFLSLFFGISAAKSVHAKEDVVAPDLDLTIPNAPLIVPDSAPKPVPTTFFDRPVVPDNPNVDFFYKVETPSSNFTTYRYRLSPDFPNCVILFDESLLCGSFHISKVIKTTKPKNEKN